MKFKSLMQHFFAFALALSLISATLPTYTFATVPALSQSVESDLEQRIAKIEKKVLARQKELGIPGISVAIVKDGKILLSKGYGYKDFEKKVPMTADTQLAIGSATKAFTALSVLMLQDDGKLSLDSSPSKYLPYFKIANGETNKNIQVRDLLAHSSGLNRTDLAMITGKLNRVELIKVAGNAKPMAGLREKFYYQNIMFAAAGEIVAEVAKMPWERFIPERVFGPLGMSNSTMKVSQMQKSQDYSFGYVYNFDSKETKRLPTRVLDAIAPAGSINSSSNDMAKWLQFVLSKGQLNGNRLLSKEGFEEWTKPQMKISDNGKVSYGLGWFVQDWKGKKVIQHGGNIDGFNSMVAMLPEENLGFVLLTNVSASSLGGEMMQMVWSGILEDEKSVTKAGPEQQKEVGTYPFPQAGLEIVVAIEDEQLVMKVPGQPTYPLIKVEGRKYELGGTPGGYYITFNKDGALMEQPEGKAQLQKKGSESESTPVLQQTQTLKELVGKYELDGPQATVVEVKEVDGKISLIAPGQSPYPLEEESEDAFISPILPSGYMLKVIRGKDKGVTGIIMVQPEGEFNFSKVRTAEKKTADISPEDLITKMIIAMGGEAKLRKITSRYMEFNLDAVHQGVKGTGKTYSKAPNKVASKTTLTALGKNIGWIEEYFDGSESNTFFSFAENETATGVRLNDVKFSSDFYPFLDHEEKLEKVEIVGKAKLGDKDVYVLAVYPKDASRVILRVSADDYMILKYDSILVSSTSSQRQSVSSTFEDYRMVDGIMVPFKVTTTTGGMGDIVNYITKVQHNVTIPDKKFTK